MSNELLSNASQIAQEALGQQVLPELITITKDTYYDYTIWMLAIGFVVGAISMIGFLHFYHKQKAKQAEREKEENPS